MREQYSAEKLHEMTQSLCRAITTKNSESTEKIISFFIDTINDAPEKFIPLFFIKIKKSSLFPGNNALFFLTQALQEAALNRHQIVTEKLITAIELLFEKCEFILLLKGFFEQYRSISKSMPSLLCFIVNAAENAPSIEYKILYKIFFLLGKLEKSQLDKDILINIALAQTCLQKSLKNYIETIHDIDQLSSITAEKTVLSALIDYQADALSAFEEYNLRGFVKQHIARKSAYMTLQTQNCLNH